MFELTISFVFDTETKTGTVTIGKYAFEVEFCRLPELANALQPRCPYIAQNIRREYEAVNENLSDTARKKNHARAAREKEKAPLEGIVCALFAKADEDARKYNELPSSVCRHELRYGEPPRNRYTKEDAEDPAYLPPNPTEPAGCRNGTTTTEWRLAGYDKMLDPCKDCGGDACPVCWQGGEFSICDRLMKRLGHCADMARNEGADELADCYLSLWQVVKQARRLYELELDVALDYANTLMHWVDTCMGELEPKLREAVCDEDD